MNLVSNLVSDGRRVLAAALSAADGPLDDDGVLREEDLEDGGPLRVDLAPVLLLVEHHVHRAVVVRGRDAGQHLFREWQLCIKSCSVQPNPQFQQF